MAGGFDGVRNLREAQQVAVVADVGALTSAASTAAPTKVEFDKTVADLVTIRTQHNALLAALRAARIIAS